MDAHELEMFLTVAEELHFGRAAERMHLAQPHLSRTIRRLEHDLGVTLFDRSTRRVELTPAGLALIEPARLVVATCAEARSDVKAAERGESGRVRLSFAGPSSSAVVGKLARSVRERYPKIDLVFRPGRFGPEVFRQVLDGTTDLAVARFENVPLGIKARPIVAEHYVVAIPSTHRLASEDKVSLAQLRDDPFITLPPSPGSSVSTDFNNWCYHAGFSPNIVQIAPDSWTILALVAAGVGATFTVDTAVAHAATEGIHVLRLEEDVTPVYAYLAWSEDSPNAALRNVLDVSQEVFPTP